MSSEIGKPGKKFRGRSELAIKAMARAKERSPRFVNPVNRNPTPEFERGYIHAKPTGRMKPRIR